MAPAAQNPSFVNTPRTHLPVEGGASTVQITQQGASQYSNQTTSTTRSSARRVKKVSLLSFPTMAFLLFIVIDIIDIFAGLTWILSVAFNVVIGVFASLYIKNRIKQYDGALDDLENMTKKTSKKSTQAKKKRLKKTSGKQTSKETKKMMRKTIGRFVIYGAIPGVQILASWAFFLFMYYKQEKKLVDEINEAAETVAQAQAEAAATVRVSLQ